MSGSIFLFGLLFDKVQTTQSSILSDVSFFFQVHRKFCYIFLIYILFSWNAQDFLKSFNTLNISYLNIK